MLLRARILLPVTSPPIDNGGVLVRDGRVIASGRWPEVCALASGDEIVDLGNMLLLPGLVNAHAHLEYTGLAGQLGGANGFARWVRDINAAKAEAVSPDTATEQWLAGAAMLLDSGTTTLADVQTRTGARAAAPRLTALRVIPFIEMTGVIHRQPPLEMIAEAEALLSASGANGGFSPHSPYATMPELLEAVAAEAARSGRSVMIHVAESAEEFQMYVQGEGALYELIAGFGRPMTDCDGRTPVQHLARAGLLQKRAVLVHANYLNDEDVTQLGSSGVSVVHCPGSHAFFGHDSFRYLDLRRAGVNICLGTDSLATMAAEGGDVPELNMLAEMRRFRHQHLDISAREILAMTTINGARALGLESEAGSLRVNSRADLIGIPYSGGSKLAEEAVLSSDARAEAVFIGGRRIK